MLMAFMVISFILAKISTPAWQRDVRQITHQFVEALREAKKGNTGTD